VVALRRKAGRAELRLLRQGQPASSAVRNARQGNRAKIQPISYRGIAPAITAVLTGEVQTTLGSVAVAAGHIEAKKLKALAIGRQARLPSHPDIPTRREAGFPDIEPLSWFGLFAPAQTPPAIVAKIQQAVASVLNERSSRRASSTRPVIVALAARRGIRGVYPG
jgi:tripartite-type tricarboxylate transporter receptor subunit TctC